MVLHVHVWLATCSWRQLCFRIQEEKLTAIGDPKPRAVAAFFRACRHIGWDVVPSLAKERRAVSSVLDHESQTGVLLVSHRENNKVIHGDLADIALVRDSPGRSTS